MNKNNISADTQHKIENTFKYYRQGSSVPSDGNCGLHAICKALVEGVLMINKKTSVKSLMRNIFRMFDLQKLPNYWWSDEELAVIANYYGYDMYIYNETDKTGIVFGKGLRPPLVLYSVNNNSHWIPGKKTLIPSSRIPKNFTIVENISEVISIKQITIKIKGHLLTRSLNVDEEFVGNYSGIRNRSRSISSGGRVKSRNRRHNESRSGVRDDGRSQSGKNKVNLNKRRDDSRSGRQYGSLGSGGRDSIQIARRDESCPILEGSCGGISKDSCNGEEKVNYSGKEEESPSGDEKEEENLGEKSDESLLMPCTPPVNDSHSCGMDKKKLSLLSKSKNTMIRKMIKQFCHWDRKKKNKYNRLVLLDSEDKGDDFDEAEFNVIYNSRYSILCDILNPFASINERALLLSESSDSSMPSQPLEPSVVQFELENSNPQLEPVEIECPPMVDVNAFSIEAVDSSSNTSNDCCLSTSTDCYSNGSIACSSNAFVESYSNAFVDSYSNAAVNYPFIPSNCPLATPESPCDPINCAYTSFEYTNYYQLADDNNYNDFFDSYALGQDNDIDSVFNQTVTTSNKKAPPAVGSMVVASAIASSLMAASVVASPIMAAEVLGTLDLELLVMQDDPEMVVTPEATPAMMVSPKMTTPTRVTPPANDLVTALGDNDLTAVPIKKNLVVTSADNNPMASPIMAAEVVGTLDLELLVMQDDPEMAVTPEATPAMMVSPKMTTPTRVTPPANDLVTALGDNDLTAVPIKKNLVVTSADNNPMASPIMAAEVVGTLDLELLVMQDDPEMAVTPEATPAMMVSPAMTTPTRVTPPVNDLVTALGDNDLTAVPIQKNLVVTSADNNPMVKPNTSVRRHFSLKKLWRKKK